MKKTASKFGALIASIAMVLVAVGALTTASYAWFTNSLTATVSDMTIQASTSKALLISAEKDKAFGTSVTEKTLWGVDTNFVSKVKEATGNNAAFSTAATRKITSVTPKTINTNAVADSSAVIEFQQLKPSVVPTASGAWTASEVYDNAAAPQAATATASYLQFDLFFKASFGAEENTTQNLVLDLTSTTGSPASAYAGTTVTNATAQQLSKSIRYGFISNKTDETLSNATNNSVTVFAPSKDDDNIAADAQVPVDTNKTGYTKRVLSQAATDSPVNGAAFNAGNLETSDLVLLEGIVSDTVYQVRVVIWVEGNDIDCSNLVSSDSIISSLAFKLSPVVTPAP